MAKTTNFSTLMDSIATGATGLAEVSYPEHYFPYWEDPYFGVGFSTGHYVDVLTTSLTYTFAPHQHPFVQQLIAALLAGGVRGLQAKDTEYRRPDPDTPGAYWVYQVRTEGAELTLREDFFDTRYDPNPEAVPELSAEGTGLYPLKELDFTDGGAYAGYNWELFYHVPLTVGIHLSRSGRYVEAQRWFHYVFDPTDNSDGAAPERFWKVKPFQEEPAVLIESLLLDLARGDNAELVADTVAAIDRWRAKPFRPHAVARGRISAFMMKAVTAYLDNLIAWGDNLFRQDTIETINEATQLYVLAANILGPRPQVVPKQGTVRPETYESLRPRLDAFSNALVPLETDIPFDVVPLPPLIEDEGRGDTLATLDGGTAEPQEHGGPTALYFCVPRNDKLLGYWDTVADRLFKIRNSLNLQGIFRQLPLFEPPIDPALLARAAAAGLDLAAVVAAANQPLPLVRFQTLMQKATEICQEVKALGGGLLAALEKEDNEALAILRAQHERVILGMAEAVKYSQLQEAIKNREGLQTAIVNAAQRYIYFERLLGVSESEIKLPEIDAIDTDGLLSLKFRAEEPEVRPRPIAIDLEQELGDGLGGRKLLKREAEEMEKLELAQNIQDGIRLSHLAAQALEFIPDIGVHFHYWGLGGRTDVGGKKLARAVVLAADALEAYAGRLNFQAGRAGKIGGFERREIEWAFQSNTVAGEITHLYKQLRAAEIREALAQREWENHQRQMEQAAEIERFLTDDKDGKRSNKAFYTWMKREVQGLHSQCFQFAFDVAKKAERALQHELGDPNLTYLQFGYMAGKEGLLAGEKLYFDLKRMDMAFMDLNQREYELTKHVSVLQLNPDALLSLRRTGQCTVSVPEELFDMDGPGHYFRRIKSVAVSVPCVVGPHTGVNCTLRLLKSSVRTSPQLDGENAEDPYRGQDFEDRRFRRTFGSVQAVVASTGQNDSGLFETNLRDERYLPFEGAGVISEWQIELPPDVRQFDYATISDVILHIRYTARDGGVPLRDAATTHLKTSIANQPGWPVRLFSVREEFPTAWARFQPQSHTGATLTLDLREEHYPFWSRGLLGAIKEITLFAAFPVDAEGESTVQSLGVTMHENPEALEDDATHDKLEADTGEWKGLLKGPLAKGVPTSLASMSPADDLTLTFDEAPANAQPMTDLWIAIRWGKA
jgi:hypothetical protein